MLPEQITQISAAANKYLKEKGLTQGELATRSGIGAAYVNMMLQGKTKVGTTDIADKYWRLLAAAVGMPLKIAAIPVLQTSQFKKIISTIQQARKRCKAQTIIGDTGAGKTLSIKVYAEKVPKHTYVVTMNDLLTVNEIMGELLRLLGMPNTGTTAGKFYQIVVELRKIANAGGEPVLIFDESENVKTNTMKLLKGFFDRLEDLVPIILVGTPDLMRKMYTAKNKGKDAAPQFFRRFEPGTVYLDGVDTTFALFFDELGIVDKGLRKLLCDLCSDYGTLCRWLNPVIAEALDKGEPVTEALFRVHHNMPNMRAA